MSTGDCSSWKVVHGNLTIRQNNYKDIFVRASFEDCHKHREEEELKDCWGEENEWRNREIQKGERTTKNHFEKEEAGYLGRWKQLPFRWWNWKCYW